MRRVKLALISTVVVLCAGIVLGGFAGHTVAGAPVSQQQGQRQGPPGAIRVHVRLVPVDVIVTDKDGKPVSDLVKEDFTILENGKPQEIQHFVVQKLSPEQAPAGKPVQLRKVPTLDLAPQGSRTFLILLGRGRHQTPFRNVDQLISFVRRDLLPQDNVAIFAYNRATDFTTDHKKIEEVLQRYKKFHESIESKLELRFSGLAAIYGSRAMPKSLQPEINRIFATADGLGSREVPPGRVTGRQKMAEDDSVVSSTLQRMESAEASGLESAAASPFDQLEVDSLTDMPFDQYAASSAMTNQDVQNLFTSIEYLRYMEGEKHLLFFTEKGLFLPRIEYDKGIAAVANDARVVIDTFQTGGVALPVNSMFSADSRGSSGRMPGGIPPQPRRTGEMSQTWALSSLRRISEMTGGQASIHEDVGKSLSHLNDVTRAEYLLGYYPKQANWDGNYRRITVRVSRPGLKVFYRRGYYARDTLQPYNHEEFLTYSRISAAAGFSTELSDLPFKVTATPQSDSGGQAVVRVDMQIDAGKVRFTSDGDRHKGKLHITIFSADPKGRLLGEEWRTLDMNLQEDTYQRILKAPIPVSIPIPLKDPKQLIKVVVYDYSNDLVGSLVTHVNAK